MKNEYWQIIVTVIQKKRGKILKIVNNLTLYKLS